MPELIAALAAIARVLLALITPITPIAPIAPPATVSPNDNRVAAGTLRNGVLTVQLEARPGMWYPEGASGRGLEVAAFAEPGKPAQTPGPLIRVPLGTEVRATLRNTLTRPLTVFGFGAVRGRADSVVVAAGATRDVRFTANAAGTFYYMAQSKPGPFGLRPSEDTQLNGAIVVDAPDAPAAAGNRVFIISWWFTLDSASKTGLGRATMAINGLSWPHTERIDLVQNDSARWRVINLTESDHPMHLHGFYFQMRSKGNGVKDSSYAHADQRLAVTEILNPFETMSLAWSPTRPGNWIYHCHFIGHLSHIASLDTYRGEQDESAISHHGSDRPHQMYGLVLGIRVAPKGPVVADARVAKPIRLLMREKAGVYGSHAGYAFVLGGTSAATDAGAVPAPPGPTLFLQRGERVAITIVNQSKDRAAVHWHGIELESYPDGVPDWSGHDKEILPSVGPGDSITVRFTPPRAGTFMYHSHFNEAQQISSGLYGAIVVLEPGQRFDATTDRIMFFSSGGPTENVIVGPWAPILLNGKAQPDTMDLRAGTKYRFRMIDLTDDVNTIVSLTDGDKPVQWRMVAKDGAALPASQATVRDAQLRFDPGEIYDFEYMPATPHALTLTYGPPDAPPEAGLPKKVKVAVRVR